MAFAAKSQKLEKPTIDPINGDTSISTKKEVIFNKFSIVLDYLSFTINKISLPNSASVSYSLVFDIAKGYGSDFTIEKGSAISIKFTNGKILELSASLRNNSQYFHSSGSQIGTSYVPGSSGYQASAWYNLSMDDIDTLKSNDIVFIRINTTEAPFDYEIKKKNAEAVKKALALFNLKK